MSLGRLGDYFAEMLVFICEIEAHATIARQYHHHTHFAAVLSFA
jgi:hypothetical protein